MSDPWLKFYPTDWRSDPALRMCSMAARGLWIEMIALMHEAVPYGHLLVAGRSPTEAQLAVLVGAPSDQISDMIGELDAAGVFSRTREGVIYSRKMTRTAKKAAIARKNGKNGGNPSLSKKRENSPSDNPKVMGQDKPQKPEARSQKEEDTNVSLSAEPTLPDLSHVDEIAEAVADYNRTAEDAGWPVLRILSKPRRAALNCRLRECGGIEGWRAALAKARASPHCCGQNERGWTANFDFLTRQSSFAKLMEGNYDARPTARQDQRTAARSDATAREIAFAARARRSPREDCF